MKISSQGAEVPFYIWYDDYPEHASQAYKGRVSKVRPGGQYGLASLILTEVKDTDRGWYNCKVLFLNREPNNAVVSAHSSLTQNASTSWGTRHLRLQLSIVVVYTRKIPSGPPTLLGFIP